MARPPKPESEQHRNRIAVYLTDEDDELLRAIAAKKRVLPGVVARALLVKQLQSLPIIDGNSLTHDAHI